MTPTSHSLEAMYLMLNQMKPFKFWDLPNTAEINFVVTDEEDAYGTYVFDDEINMHIITISKAKCGHLDTLIKTLAHEVIHMTRGKTSKYSAHDAYFRRKASAIALELGFDPLEL